MKTTLSVALVLIAAGSVRGEEPGAGGALELTSLHGTMITMISEVEGMPMEIWAKGDNVRAEFTAGEAKVITIQLGDTMYTFGPGSTKGEKRQFTTGLAAMGLVKQIAEVKSKGKQEGSQEIEGVVYDQYIYDVDAPQEMAVVFLAAKTSLPKFWISAVQTGEKQATAVKMHYRDMEANVEVPDAMFELPKGLTFTEPPAATHLEQPQGPAIRTPR